MAEVSSFKTKKWSTHFYDLIRYYVKIFTKITLVNTNFFVAFNKVVSIYDIVKKEWKSHFFFSHDVIEVFRNQKKSKNKDVNVAAYLDNGDLKIIDTIDVNGDNWGLKDQTLRIEGKVETIVSDWRDISSHYIMTKMPNGMRRFTGFQFSQVQDLGIVAQSDENDELIRFISPNFFEDFALLNRQTKEIRSFINQETGEGMMNISESRKFLLAEPDKIKG